jgi:hypothetical protein
MMNFKIGKYLWSDYLVLVQSTGCEKPKLTFLTCSFLPVEESAKLSKWMRFFKL